MGRRELAVKEGQWMSTPCPRNPSMSSHSSHTLHGGGLGRKAEGGPGSPSSLPAREALQLAFYIPGSALLLHVMSYTKPQ